METLRQLDQKNRQNLKLLPPNMQLELQVMFDCLRHSRINSYDSVQISADLIAMAAEAHSRGEALADIFGENSDREALCRQLAEAARPKSKLEAILFWLRVPAILLPICTVLPLLNVHRYLIPGASILSYTLVVTPGDMKLYLAMCLYGLVGRYSYRLAYRSASFQHRATCGAFVLCFGLSRIGSRLVFGMPPLFQVPYVAAILTALCLLLVVEVGYRMCVRPPSS